MTLQNIAYIPLEIAARKYGVSKKVLRQRALSNKILSATTPNGDLLVADHNIDPNLDIKRENFEHLRGQRISVSDASENYGVPQTTLSKWAKHNYIKVLKRGWKVLLDEADVAYCAAVYKAKYKLYDGQMSGVPVFDRDGNPYQVKHRETAAMMRQECRKYESKTIQKKK